MNRIYTGSYKNCKSGNLISISGDRGKRVGFCGKAIPALAPKKKFWDEWYDMLDKVSKEESMKFYIENYYNEVLKKVDIEELLKDEVDPILLCFEESNEFCHRHIVANYIEYLYGMHVDEIEIDEEGNIKVNDIMKEIKTILKEIINNEK